MALFVDLVQLYHLILFLENYILQNTIIFQNGPFILWNTEIRVVSDCKTKFRWKA